MGTTRKLKALLIVAAVWAGLLLIGVAFAQAQDRKVRLAFEPVAAERGPGFIGRGAGFTIRLMPDGFVAAPSHAGASGRPLRVAFRGARADGRLAGEDRLPGAASYYEISYCGRRNSPT
jgi:hypothetical protein